MDIRGLGEIVGSARAVRQQISDTQFCSYIEGLRGPVSGEHPVHQFLRGSRFHRVSK